MSFNNLCNDITAKIFNIIGEQKFSKILSLRLINKHFYRESNIAWWHVVVNKNIEINKELLLKHKDILKIRKMILKSAINRSEDLTYWNKVIIDVENKIKEIYNKIEKLENFVK